MKAYATKDRARLLKYNALDVVATARSFAAMSFDDDWMSPRVQALYQQHLLLSTICAEMHTTGFPIDFAEKAKLEVELLELYEQREKKLLELVGIPGFRCNPNDMRSLIYARHATKKVSRFNLPDPVDPKMWSDEEWKTIKVDQNSLLLLLANPSCPPELVPIIDAYWQAEGVWKARSTFVTSDGVRHAIGPDGRLRAGWNSAGTDTGRFSCSEPNLMNIPADKDEGSLSGAIPNIRRMYWAGPGNVIVHADKKQLELFVMYAVSGDEVLGQALLGDVYTEDAKDVFNLSPHLKKCECQGGCKEPQNHLKSKVRKTAKGVHLGFQYGAGTNAVHGQLLKQMRTIRYHETALVHEGMKRRYKGTVAYWHREHERVRATGYSESRIMGRRRVYPREPPPTETANYPIQSTAADIMNIEIIDLWRALKRFTKTGRLVAQVHDAVDIICSEKEQRTVEDIVSDVMNREHEIEGRKHLFAIDGKTATHWSDV